MPSEDVEVVVIGAGQAGLAMSEHLSARGIPHIVLERDRVVERWRSERWDSLRANGPVWHDRFPGLEFDLDPNAFATKDQVVDYFVRYAHKINAPIRTGVEATEVRRNPGQAGFRVTTSQGTFNARYVVAATGAFQLPVIPSLIPEHLGLRQIHSSIYRNPTQMPDGAVLVVGAGSSGVQIADELQKSGRRVYLSVGPHDRPPRRYRGLDFVWWLGVLGKWEAVTPPLGAEHVTIAVSGADGGRTVDFRELANTGVELLGRTESCADGTILFAPDLANNIHNGDANYLSLLDEADEYIKRNGLDLPVDLTARNLGSSPDSIRRPTLELNLVKEGITSIIWATGYDADYSWLHVDTFDDRGRPKHQRGVSADPGLCFLGLPWQSRRGSSFIWGVWHDAQYIADHIAIQRGYAANAKTLTSPPPRSSPTDDVNRSVGDESAVTTNGVP